MRKKVAVNIVITAYVVSCLLIICFCLSKISERPKQQVTSAETTEETFWGVRARIEWTEVCWVRALDKLNELRSNENVLNAKMVMEVPYYNGKYNDGHAWVKYILKDGDRYYTVEYDPGADTITSMYEEFEEMEVSK